MATFYTVLEHKSVVKAVKGYPKHIRQSYQTLITKLKTAPRECIDKQLAGFSIPTYSHRINDYRVLFTINDKEVKVFVIKAEKRSEVYKSK